MGTGWAFDELDIGGMHVPCSLVGRVEVIAERRRATELLRAGGRAWKKF